MPSRSKGESARLWDRTNRRTVGTQVSVQEAEAIKAFASRNGETVSAMIKRLIREEMSDATAQTISDADSYLSPKIKTRN